MRDRCPKRRRLRLAAQLLGHDTRPSEAAIRAEVKIRVQEALEQYGPARSRGAGLAALRAVEPRRDRPGARHLGGRRRQAVHPGSGAAQRILGRRPADWED